VQSTASQLADAGWQITFLLACDPEAVSTFHKFADKRLPGASVYSVDELLTDLTPDEVIPQWGFHFYHYYLSYRIALALRKLCRQSSFSGIEFNDYPGLGYVTLKWRRLWGDIFANVPLWVRLHGASELCVLANDARKYSAEQEQLFEMERYCLRNADGWISPSQETADYYCQALKLDRVPIVVDLPSFNRYGPGKSHSRQLSQSPHRILFYGKLQKLKGIETFIQAGVECCEAGVDLAFEIIGQEDWHPWGLSSYKADLDRMIPERWRSRFHFVGRIDPNELEQTALQADLAVVPSLFETFCLAAHELNWIGIPLVLNDIPAFRAYFQDKKNARFYDGTSHNLARVIQDVLRSPDPFAAWEWNGGRLAAANHEQEAYLEALKRFSVFVPSPAPEPQPLVSIVIPYYNLHEYVDATIASVRASSYSHLEVILVDDGSTDRNAQLKFDELEQSLKPDGRFLFFRKENGGLGSARNFGIRQARGRYILPLDSDDLIHPSYIEKGVQALNRLPDVSAVSCFVSYFADGRAPEEIIDYVIPYDLHPLLIALENRAGVACSIFRREVFDRFQYNENLISYEDWNLWWTMAEAGCRVETMPVILYRYRRRTTSMFNETAIPRHVFVMNRMADDHPKFLAQHGAEIFRMYTFKMNELRQENARLRASPSGQMDLLARRLYRELRTIRGSMSFQFSQRLRGLLRGPFPMMFPARKEASPATGHNLTIEVLEDKNARSLGQEVWLGGLRLDESSIYLLTPFRQHGKWVLKTIEHPFLDQVYLAVSPGHSLHTRVNGENFGLIFLNHPWSGQVRLVVDNQRQIFDLYAPENESGYHELCWNGSDWQRCEALWEKR
jgi:glycosyltransferase involved in cell wall biosynthesis